MYNLFFIFYFFSHTTALICFKNNYLFVMMTLNYMNLSDLHYYPIIILQLSPKNLLSYELWWWKNVQIPIPWSMTLLSLPAQLHHAINTLLLSWDFAFYYPTISYWTVNWLFIGLLIQDRCFQTIILS